MLALSNGRIYTGEAWAGALLIEDNGRVVGLSRDGSGWPASGSVDLEGRTVLPGFIDAHLHLSHLAARARALTFSGRESPAELGKAVRRLARERAVGTWILGYGYDDSAWGRGSTTRGLLDAAAPAHPVFLQRKDLHSGWVNSLALRRAGIDESVNDPAGGRFERDTDGRLTGIVKENARRQFLEAIPRPTGLELETLLLETLQRLGRMGLTTVCTIGDRTEFTALQRLHARGALPLRVCQFLTDDCLEEVCASGWQSGLGDDHLWFGGVKFFADGSLGSRTAWLEEPYEGTADTGIALIEPQALCRKVRTANGAGVAVAIHAIGDRALRVALDAIDEARTEHSRLEALAFRNRIEHVQLGASQGFARMSSLQVIASMQPTHAPADRILADRGWGARCRDAYAWRSLLDAGVTLAFGSDAPVESADPLLGLRAAITRQDPAGQPAGGWYPEQRLSSQEALRAYGSGAARAVGRPGRLGRLEPGAWGDLVVVEGDPASAGARVTATYVGGKAFT